MFENLQQKLEDALKKIRGNDKITEENISNALEEVRKAMIDADVNFHVAKKFIDDVKQKALGIEVKGSVLPGQLMIKVIHDELTTLMGSQKSELFLQGNPTVIMVAGLQGSGKTTFCGKLAASLRKKGKQPLLVACDTYRPAAIEQLKLLAQSINVPCFSLEGANPVNIATEALIYGRKFSRDVIIIDTAGRLTIDEEMMLEVENIKSETKPHEILFVCDAMTGQDAVTTAKSFNDRLNLTGVVLTKLDGDTRGGAALSIREVVGKPIKFVGTGEKMDALELFHPERIASRILGMGDILSLVEKAQHEFDEKEAEKIEEKIRKNQFTFDDFISQLKMIKKMGSLKDLLGMLPGMDKALRGVNVDDSAFTKVEAIISSMTNKERATPALMNSSRKKRIAKGSGSSLPEVNRFLQQFEEMKKFMKRAVNGQKSQLQPTQRKSLKMPTGFKRF